MSTGRKALDGDPDEVLDGLVAQLTRLPAESVLKVKELLAALQ